MYEIKRENGRVIISRNSMVVFNAADSAYVIYEKGGAQTVNTVKELPDAELLTALANAVLLKT